jgi:GDP/UDP-N,N'-diacetylbacillosamine 2-epimerase (hydrolysing)
MILQFIYTKKITMKEKALNKIAIFTGNRAEFGYLFPLILQMKDNFNLELFISGAHLLPPWNTVEEIEWKFAEHNVKCKLHKIYLKGLKEPYKESFGRIYQYSIDKLNSGFKYSIVLGDRIESMGFASASFFMNIPIVHINGGDIVNVPYFDTNVRHAITKIAHLHLVNNKKSGKVVEQMGEEKWRIHNIGTLSLDYDSLDLITEKIQLAQEFAIKPQEKVILLTYHSAHYKTAEKNLDDYKTVLKAVIKTGLKVLITYPNNDPGSELMLSYIHELKPSRSLKVISNLGTERILSLYKYFNVVVAGNSSGGLIETCRYKVPALNIGDRQVDRFRGNNVYNCEIKDKLITDKLNFIIKNYDMLKVQYEKDRFFFGNGKAAEKAVKILKKYENVDNHKLLFKKFIIR